VRISNAQTVPLSQSYCI